MLNVEIELLEIVNTIREITTKNFFSDVILNCACVIHLKLKKWSINTITVLKLAIVAIKEKRKKLTNTIGTKRLFLVFVLQGCSPRLWLL